MSRKRVILWRHAHAERFVLGERNLVEQGEREALEGGEWLKRFYPDCPVWISPAQTAYQTALYYADEEMMFYHDEVRISADEAKVKVALEEALFEGESALVVVGHSPWIGSLATLMTGDAEYLFFENGQILVLEREMGEQLDNGAGHWLAIDSFSPSDV
ncbi:MAG: phosphoglycerate mutase family protein [Cardiobacteriaceae bacterium]|nr:phosphoglycerate mutase family protein [Cardiobacteriaceae bacterium]